MDEVLKNVSLKSYNTFGIEVKADFFVEVYSLPDLQKLLALDEYREMDKLVLGGGSNIIFTKNFEGIVIRPMIMGKEIVSEDDDSIMLRVGSGENWDEFVEYCVINNYYGAENLSYIPGLVGAAPIQNIGAYGVEVKDLIHEVEALNIKTGQVEKFSNEECKFEYRSSIFKTKIKGKYIVINVTFRLQKQANLNLSYKGVGEKIDKMSEHSLSAMRQAIIDIRKEKLPDPRFLGNAGSTFKNPVLPVKQVRKLLAQYPEMPTYPLSEKLEKIPAGWLIEQCGWKGKRIKDAGVYEKQAIILVNLGNADSADLVKLIDEVKFSVKDKFGIKLELEVNLI